VLIALKSLKARFSNFVKGHNIIYKVHVGPSSQHPQSHTQRHLMLMQSWSWYAYTLVMENAKALEWDLHHKKHSYFLIQNNFSCFQVSTCILTISWRYSTFYFSWNMLIHWVFTFLNNLLPLVLKRLTNFWKVPNFFGLWI
jgi:hypothetical protein